MFNIKTLILGAALAVGVVLAAPVQSQAMPLGPMNNGIEKDNGNIVQVDHKRRKWRQRHRWRGGDGWGRRDGRRWRESRRWRNDRRRWRESRRWRHKRYYRPYYDEDYYYGGYGNPYYGGYGPGFYGPGIGLQFRID